MVTRYALSCILIPFMAARTFASAPPPFSASIIVVHNATCAYADGELQLVITGGLPPYNILWDDGAVEVGRAGLVAGTYGVTVTDGNSDQATAQVDLPSVNYDLDYSYWNYPYCGAPSLLVPLTGIPSEATGPWYVNGQELGIAPGSSGDPLYIYYPEASEGQDYLVEVTDGNGCMGTIHGVTGYTVEWPNCQITSVEPSCTDQYTGSIHVHVGTEGHQQGVNLFIVGVDQMPYYQGITSTSQPQDGMFTDLAPGLYGLYWGLGFTLDNMDPGTCITDTMWVTVPDQGIDCGRVSGGTWYDLDVDCTRDANEVGVPYNTLLVQPGNQVMLTDGTGHFDFALPNGSYTVEQTNATLTANCPPAVPVPVTVNSDNTVINFGDQSSAPLDLGIYSGWQLPKPGFPFRMQGEVRNYSPQVSGPLTVTMELDPALVYASAEPTPTSVAGNTLSWSLPALGSFAHMPLQVNTTVFAGTSIGTVLHSTLTVAGTVSEPYTANNTFIVSATVQGSVDPNDKTVLTSSRASDELYYIDGDDYMDYTIRFQNTGTAAATFVVVTDTLSDALDMTSFQQGVASHPFSVSFKPGRVVEWRFDDIQLADSTSDEAASHGLVSFRIKPVQPLLPGTVISNNADIFFDFNEPVRTNDAVLLAELSTAVHEAGAGSITMHPNPATDRVLVRSAGEALRSIELLTVEGRTLATWNANAVERSLDIAPFTAGSYLLRVKDASGAVHVLPLIKQ